MLVVVVVSFVLMSAGTREQPEPQRPAKPPTCSLVRHQHQHLVGLAGPVRTPKYLWWKSPTTVLTRGHGPGPTRPLPDPKKTVIPPGGTETCRDEVLINVAVLELMCMVWGTSASGVGLSDTSTAANPKQPHEH